MADDNPTSDDFITKSYKWTIKNANGYFIDSITYQGDWKAIREKALEYPVGHKLTQENLGNYEDLEGIVCDSQCVRKQGNLGELVLSIAYIRKQVNKKWFVSLDSVAIPKDIRTWMPLNEDGTEDTENKPDIELIGRWEALQSSDPEHYAQFEYKDGEDTYTKLEDNTLELAKMIYKGISTYTIHAPIITASWYEFNEADFYTPEIDKQMTKSQLLTDITRNAIGEMNWTDIFDYLKAEHFVQTDYKVTGQANGLFQVTVRWMGATEIEEKLYPKV